jgi:hypothetical protein
LAILHCLNGKRRAQARSEEKAGGVRDQSRMAVTRHEARGNAREPDGGTPGRSAFDVLLPTELAIDLLYAYYFDQVRFTGLAVSS